jgi:membrane protease YdiL (CAAX protease family)
MSETAGLRQRIGLFALFLLCGLLIFVAGDLLKNEIQVIFRICLTVAFLLIALWLRNKERRGRYFQVTFAFFIISLVTLLNSLLPLPGSSSGPTVKGYLLQQIFSTLVIVIPIVLLTKVSGNSMGSIYLQKGKLRLGLIIGLVPFLFFVILILAFPAGLKYASMFFSISEEITYEQILSLMPAVLVYVLLNGLKEELWYRGVFLRKFETFVGAWPSNILTAFVFAASHVGVSYTPALLVFLGMTFALGLVCGYVMQKTNSIIGPALFHAAMDITIVLGAFSFL